MSVFATKVMSAVETGQMSAVETGQMSAAETGQIASVPRTDICFVLTHNVEGSEVSTVPLSERSSLRTLSCGTITMFKSQKGGLALNRRKWPEMGPDWSPGPENRPPGMPRPFSRLCSGTTSAAPF